jgi:D-xylose transport system substrate-binding protein
VFIKGDKGDANSDFVRAGQDEVLRAAVNAGVIKNAGETYTDSWDGFLAQTEMKAFLKANGGTISAALSQNDGMASGVIAALTEQGLAGKVAVSGQDGDIAALNQVALGVQTVDVWKDARMLGKIAGDAAIQLCDGVAIEKVTSVASFSTLGGATLSSILLKPTPVTKDNLDVVVDAGWITRDALCDGVEASSVAACP